MESRRFRNQISWMMFGFSILVIWVHSYNVELFAGTDWGPDWERVAEIEQFWSIGIGQIAVPGFFMLSSYLFFRNFQLKNLISKWKKRLFSVAVPYVTWNLLYYFGYVIATRIPVIEHVVGKKPVPIQMEEVWNAILHYQYAPIFWYLFQLLLLFLLAPVIYGLVKNKIIGFIYLAALVMCLFLGLDTGYPNTDALFYFSCAAYAAIHWKNRMETKGDSDRTMAGVALMIVAVYSYGMMKEPGACVLWTISYRTLVPVSLWLMMSSVEFPAARPWMRQSMFLYAIHFILVRFLNKGTALVLERYIPVEVISADFRAKIACGLYFMIPMLVVMVSYWMACFLSKWMPLVWRILSGGRSIEPERKTGLETNKK